MHWNGFIFVCTFKMNEKIACFLVLMHCAHIYLCIKLQIKIDISLRLIVIWNYTRAYILVCIWEMFWNVLHTYMHAQFAALIAFW